MVPTGELLGLAEVIARAASKPITAAAVMALRRQYRAEAAAMIVAIAAEQRRAREKFGPGVWMVSAKAIRQATDSVVAAYKARLLGDHPVFDLCGGIGGDAIALSRRGAVVTIDRDPQTVAMAAANLVLADLGTTDPSAQRAGSQAVAVCADVTRYPLPPGVAMHIDPDRRPEQRRTVVPSNYAPSLDFVSRAVDSCVAGIVKLAPAADLQAGDEGLALVRRHHRQWISLDGSVREQALLCGEAISRAGGTAGGRSAVRLLRGAAVQRFAVDSQSELDRPELDHRVPSTPSVADLVVDLDPAVRGGGLSAALAITRGLVSLGGPAGFFTTSDLPEDRSLMQCFETLWSGPADLKQIQRELRRDNRIVRSIKVRGTGHDPAELQKRLRPKKQQSGSEVPAGQAVTLLIGRHSQGVFAVIARALPMG